LPETASLVVVLEPEARRLLHVDGVGNVRTVVDDEDGDFGCYPVGFVGDDLWGWGYGNDYVVRIELSDGSISRSIPFEDPCGFGLGGEHVWVASCGGRTGQHDELARIDQSTGRIVAAPLRGLPTPFVTSEGPWLAGHSADRGLWMQRVDPLTARAVGPRIEIEPPPGGERFVTRGFGTSRIFVAPEGRAFWFTWYETSEVIRIEPGADPRTAGTRTRTESCGGRSSTRRGTRWSRSTCPRAGISEA
jgi:hypothetical protein